MLFKIPIETTFWRHQDKHNECDILRPNPSEVSPYFCSAKMPKMTHFGPKKCTVFQVRTPICHIVPISRIYTPPPRGRAKQVPFALLVFFPQFHSTFWPNLGAIHVARPVVVLRRFPLFLRHLGSWNTEFTICPFRAQICPFQAPKTLHFRGKMANFEANNTIKQGKKRQDDKWYPFHACTLPPNQKTPERQTVGTATASHYMLTLQALSSSLGAGTARKAAWAKEGVWLTSGSLFSNTAASICTL